MKNPVAYFCMALLFSSCASTEYVHISVQEPAPVSLPGNIKTVGIMNRSLASKQTKILDAVDKVFSLEGANLDKDGSRESLLGLRDELMKNNRFTEIKPLNDADLRTVGAGVFPASLDWDQVDKICRDNNVDAVFALEYFDTDSRLQYAAAPAGINTPLGSVPAIQQRATMLTTVKTGWRIYDPSTRNLLDEFPLTQNISYTDGGINPAVLANVVVGRKQAVLDISNKIGHVYALRIIPYWLRVTRDYYVRGSDNFRIARRKAQTGNWDEAAQLWQQETKNPSPKVAGRACYNMAIISEINNDLDTAMRWAQKSYENYGIRLGLTYVRILQGRKNNMNLLRDQTTQAQQQQ